jgi:dihydroorotase
MRSRAAERGVILDIAHGAGSFAFRSAEAALAAGIKPHVISTDIHQMSIAGPLFDWPRDMAQRPPRPGTATLTGDTPR